MMAMQAPTFHSLFHAQTIVRINEHTTTIQSLLTVIPFSGSPGTSPLIKIIHAKKADFARTSMQGLMHWNSLAVGRDHEFREDWAIFVMWGESSVMLGYEWVPNTLEDFEDFRIVYLALTTIWVLSARVPETRASRATIRSGGCYACRSYYEHSSVCCIQLHETYWAKVYYRHPRP